MSTVPRHREGLYYQGHGQSLPQPPGFHPGNLEILPSAPIFLPNACNKTRLVVSRYVGNSCLSLRCPWIHKFSSKFMLTLTISRWREKHNFLIKGCSQSFSLPRTVRKSLGSMKWSKAVINVNETPKMLCSMGWWQQGLWATDHPILPLPLKQMKRHIQENLWSRQKSISHFTALEHEPSMEGWTESSEKNGRGCKGENPPHEGKLSLVTGAGRTASLIKSQLFEEVSIIA